MKSSFTLGQIDSINIKIHLSCLPGLGLLTCYLSSSYLPKNFGEWDIFIYWSTGALGALLLLFSVLAHEIGHSLVSKKRGLKVTSIVLYIFGGISYIENEPEYPLDELMVAVSGPLTGLILGAVLFGIAQILSITVYGGSPLIAIINFLWAVNILFAAINLIPGFPLDGGRILRSLIWHKTANLYQATTIAGNFSRFIGWSLLVIGMVVVFGFDIWFFKAGLSGIWLVVLGWFIQYSAGKTIREMRIRKLLARVQAKDLMERSPENVSPFLSVHEVVYDEIIQKGRRAVPVFTGNSLPGIVTLAEAKTVPEKYWVNTPVKEICKAPQITVDQDDELNIVMRTLAKNRLDYVPVMANDIFVGLLSRLDVIRYIQDYSKKG